MIPADADVLITGAARGIGHHIAFQLLDEARSVSVLDANKALLDELPAHPKLHKYHCNVTDPADVEKTIAAVFNTTPGINVVINNAGIIHSEPLINLLSKEDNRHSVENWKRVIDVNLNGIFYVTANVAGRMVPAKTKGVIINISSISAQGNAGQSAYAASKAGVEALTKTWSKELGMFGIRCACIAPGFFDTPSTRESLSENVLKKWERSVPIGRLGQLSELVSAVRFIMENEYFNGKVLSLDGGLSI